MLAKNVESVTDMQTLLTKTRTLTRTKNKITKSRIADKVRLCIERRTSLNRIFPRRQDILHYRNRLAIVFGTNMLKFASKNMLFYHMPLQAELKHYRITHAHFDGKFSDVPRGYRQSVELRLAMQRGEQQITITCARALLSGFKTADYIAFFERVKNAKFRPIPFIVTDFEMAVTNAVQHVFPKIKHHGCWFHYWNNLLSMSGRLSRRTKQTVSPRIIRILFLLCFVHHPNYLLLDLIDSFKYPDNQIKHRAVDFKLIMYTYRTYIKRFASMLHIDLSTSVVRTNNSCEGSNSGLAKLSAQRLSLRDYGDYVELQAKRDLVRKPKKINAPNNIDIALRTLQTISRTHPLQLADFLAELEVHSHMSIMSLVELIPQFKNK